MHPDLEKLIVLQRLDLELRQLREEVDAVPGRIAALAAKSSAAQAAQLAIKDSLAREDKQRRSLESDIQGQKDRAARLRRQMDVVTTTAQAAALEHEIAFAATEIARIEEVELDSMVRSEFLESQLPAAGQAFTAAEANLERERTLGADRSAAHRARIATLNSERAGLRPTIGEANLSTYDRVARSRGNAVSEGVGGRCSACQMVIRPQRWTDLRDRGDHESIFTCESCGRLLYWDPARDAPQKKPAEREESIAARIVRSL